MDLGAYITKGWDLLTKNLAVLLVGYIIVALILFVSSVTVVGPIILGGPLLFGFFRMVQKRYQNAAAELGEVFDFSDFSNSLLFMILLFVVGLAVGIVLIIINVILGLIPCAGLVLGILISVAAGIFLNALLLFALPLAALSREKPVESIKASVQFAFANLWPVVLLSLVLGLIAAAGSLVCGIGALFTVPLSMCAQVVAYNEYYLPLAASRPSPNAAPAP